MLRDLKEIFKKIEKTSALLSKYLEPLKILGLENQVDKLDAEFKIIRLVSEFKNYPTQWNNFINDLNIYGLATYLWLEEEYPDISTIFDSLGWNPPIQKVINIMKIRDEISSLFETVKSQYPKLFEVEIKESLKNFFNKQEKPSQIIREENPFFLDIEKLILSIIEEFNDTMQGILKNVEVVSNKVKLNGKIKNARKFLNKVNQKNLADGYFEKLNLLNIKIRNFHNPSEIFEKHPESIARRILNKILTYDSYQVQLIKFYYRLFWILKNGNHNYPSHTIDSFPNYKKLINFLKLELSLDYNNLSRYFFLSFNALTTFRHIRAHELPIIRLTKNNKYAIMTQKGNKNDIRFSLKYMEKLINTYILFSEIHIHYLE